jgi:peptidoglycan/xylan/chitin deacetylase (PgdA/CDA1 family)
MKKRIGLLTVLLLLALLFQFQLTPPVQATLAVIPEKTVTLTFDDGPDPRFTPEILGILRERHIPATFFIVGEHALAHPDLVRKVVQEGHVLANHTMTHPHLETFTADEVRSELLGVDQALLQILGPAQPVPRFFRPPRGKQSEVIRQTALELHKQTVLWNVCLENSSTTSPEAVERRVVQLVEERGGGILLAHDGELDRTLTVQSLPRVLDTLLAKGYRFIPLAEYLQAQREKLLSRK